MNFVYDKKKLNVIEKQGVHTTLYENNIWLAEFKKSENRSQTEMAEIFLKKIELTLQNQLKVGWKSCLVIDSFSEMQWSQLVVPGSHILLKSYDAVAIVNKGNDSESALAQFILNELGTYVNINIFSSEAESLLWLEKQKTTNKNWNQIKEDYINLSDTPDFREKIIKNFEFLIPILSVIYAVLFAKFNHSILSLVSVIIGGSLSFTHRLFKTKPSDTKYLYFMTTAIIFCGTLIVFTGGLKSPFNALLFLTLLMSGIFVKGRNLLMLVLSMILFGISLRAYVFLNGDIPVIFDLSNMTWLKSVFDATCFCISAYTLVHFFKHENKLKNDLQNFKEQANSDSNLILARLQRFSLMDFSPLYSEIPQLQAFRGVHNSIDYLAETLRSKSISNDFLDSLINKLHVGVIIVDDHQRISFCNEQFMKMCDSISPIYKELTEIIKTDAKELYGIQVEHWLEVNHKLLPLKVVIQDLNSQKMYICEDLTYFLNSAKERIEIQQQLTHSAKLISLGTMAAGLAHEVNNPLAIIMGYAQMLKNNTGSVDKILDQADKIIFQTKRIGKIINDLRIFSRNDKNTEDDGINIFSVLNDSQMYLNDHFRRNNIHLEIKIGVEFILKGRAIEFQSVMQNLLSNSRDAFQDHPEITNKEITIKAEVDKDFVDIFYHDNAGGIKPEIIEKIFDPFFTTKEPGRGTGLGMSIMRTLIEVNGGHIKVSSNYGHDTDFVIRWPLLSIISNKSAV